MAGYNSYFPTGYQPAYYPQMQQNNQGGSIIWVQGEAGAKSYLVAPNTSVVLWDSEAQVIYIKSADAAGLPSIKTLDYTMRDSIAQTGQIEAQGDFATKEDISLIKEEIEALKEELKPKKIKASER